MGSYLLFAFGKIIWKTLIRPVCCLNLWIGLSWIEIVFFRVDKIVKERKNMHKMYITSSNSIRLLKVNVKNNNNSDK